VVDMAKKKDCDGCRGLDKEKNMLYKLNRDLQAQIEDLHKQLSLLGSSSGAVCPSCGGPLEKEASRTFKVGDYFQEVTHRFYCEPCMNVYSLFEDDSTGGKVQ
jgi:uncharacterized protein with PIN domain